MNPPPDAPQLPPNLPPLPPVPDGYDRWEYRGMGFKSLDEINYARHHGNSWWVFEETRPTGANEHYIEAVKSSPAVPVKAGENDLARVLREQGMDFEAFKAGEPEGFANFHPLWQNGYNAGAASMKGNLIDGKNALAESLAQYGEPPVTDTRRVTPRTDAEIERINDSTEDYAWRDMCAFARTLERELAAAQLVLSKVEAVLVGYVATSGFEDGTLESKVECLLHRADEQDQLEDIINRAAGLPAIEDPEEGIIRLQNRAEAAQDDSKRLEWLLASDFVDSALITNRDEIDDAMRKGEL